MVERSPEEYNKKMDKMKDAVRGDIVEEVIDAIINPETLDNANMFALLKNRVIDCDRGIIYTLDERKKKLEKLQRQLAKYKVGTKGNSYYSKKIKEEEQEITNLNARLSRAQLLKIAILSKDREEGQVKGSLQGFEAAGRKRK